MRRYTLAVVTALLALTPWHEAIRADAPLYTVQNLGSYLGEVPTIAGINAAGQVAGNVSTNGSQAVRYTDGSGWQALPGLDQSFSVATGINASGDVVGWRITSQGQFRAFRYRDLDGLKDIDPLPGGSMTFGFGINDAGDIVGFSDSANGPGPFRAAVGLLAEALPTLGGGQACGINASGQVAGFGNTSSGAQHGMRIDSGAATAVDLSSPAGPTFNVTTCAIDSDGRVAGQAGVAANVVHAVRYVGGSGVDLDTFGSPSSNVESIAGGLSVGWYTASNGSLRAFAHRDADGSFDLNTRIDAPGWVLALAKGVNANGVIAGEGTLNGAPAVFRLTPLASTDTTAPVISSVTATPSSIFPPNGQLVPVTIAVNATDDSGTAPVCTLTSITGPGTSPTDFNVTGALSGNVLAVGGRTYTFTATCVDAASNSASSSATVFVVPDTTAPVITSLSAAPGFIWPANNKWVAVSVSVSATDDVDASPACRLTGVTGGPASDVVVTGLFSASVRAVKNDNGSVRTYLFNVTCSDASGNASDASVSVSVSKDTPSKVFLHGRRSWGNFNLPKKIGRYRR